MMEICNQVRGIFVNVLVEMGKYSLCSNANFSHWY